MAVLVGAQVVEPVAERQYLGVGTALAHLLNSAVYVTATDVDLAYLLALKGKVKVQYSVCGRVLWAYVYDELVIVEYLQLLHNLGHLLVILYIVFALELLGGLTLKANGIQCLARVIILAQGVSYPVVAQEQASKVVVPGELDAEKVEHLALIQLRYLPYVADGRYLWLLALCGAHANLCILTGVAVLEYIYRSKALFAPVHSHDLAQEVHSSLALTLHCVAELVQLYESDLHLCHSLLSSPVG